MAMFLCAVFTVTYADDRSEKVRELMEAQGLVETFQQQLQAGRERTRNMANQMLDKMLASLNPPAEFQAKFRDAAGEFIQAAQAPRVRIGTPSPPRVRSLAREMWRAYSGDCQAKPNSSAV
jgi:hypothetical protein